MSFCSWCIHFQTSVLLGGRKTFTVCSHCRIRRFEGFKKWVTFIINRIKSEQSHKFSYCIVLCYLYIKRARPHLGYYFAMLVLYSIFYILLCLYCMSMSPVKVVITINVANCCKPSFVSIL